MMCARHHPSCRNPDGVWQFFCHPLPHRNDGEDGRGRSVDMLDIDRPVLAIIPPIEIDHKIARCQRRSLNWWTALISLCEKMCCGFSFSFLSLIFFRRKGGKKNLDVGSFVMTPVVGNLTSPANGSVKMTHRITIAHLVCLLISLHLFFFFFSHQPLISYPFYCLEKRGEIAAVMSTLDQRSILEAFGEFRNSEQDSPVGGILSVNEWTTPRPRVFSVSTLKPTKITRAQKKFIKKKDPELA